MIRTEQSVCRMRRLFFTGISGRHSCNSSRPAALYALCAALLCLVRTGYAELYSGRVYTEPAIIYVNQPFDMFLELEVSRGLDIGNIRVQGFPNDPDYIALGALEQDTLRRSKRRTDGSASDLLLFKTRARCLRSMSQSFSPVLSCEVVERRSRGFFSYSSSSLKRIQLNTFNLTVRDLPKEGQPADFSGAVGSFSLSGSISRGEVRPGDLITLSLELSGDGWLNNAAPPAPPVSSLFKSYPPKETLREDNRIRTEQILIPGSTNAVTIPPASFAFFNPKTARYETCRSTEFRLRFIAAGGNLNTNEVMVISADQNTTAIGSSVAVINARQVNRALHKILPVAVACITLLAASFVFLSLKRFNRWTAAAVTLLVLGAGTILTFKCSARKEIRTAELKRQSGVHLAPSLKSPVILTLRSKTSVIPLENTANWTRVEVEGHSGWIQNSAL